MSEIFFLVRRALCMSSWAAFAMRPTILLTPRYDRHSRAAGSAVQGSETHQVFGTWAGRLRTDDGLELALDGLQGFAEEARQHW